MKPTRAGKLVLALAALTSLGAAPAAPTAASISRQIEQIRAAWQGPDAHPQPNAAGWNALFDRLNADLEAYRQAPSEDDRLRALDRLHRISAALAGSGWGPALQVQQALHAWLRPRVALAWAVRHVRDSARGSSAQAEPWLRFTDDALGSALRDYEGAPTVAARRAALHRVYAALNALDRSNRQRPWPPSLALEQAVNNMYNLPNLDATADVYALSPFLNQQLVQSGPIVFKGQLSYVTAGPKTGFGLMASDDGIAFYNSQIATSVTPINNFQQQVAQDPKGKRAAKLYNFNATTQDTQELTMYAVLRTTGLALAPAYLHNISASIGSAPTQGKGLVRGIAALIGLNQANITNQVYQGAVGKIQEGVVSGASELGAIKTSQAAGEQNAKIQRFFPNPTTLVVNNFAVTSLRLASRPEYALVGGRVEWLNADEQLGADSPQPAFLDTFQPGVAADVHLPSVASNLARGYIQSPAAQNVHNLMIVTHKVPPGAPPGQGIVTTQNVDWATFTRAVDTARAANDPAVLAVRVKRPGRSPEFGADARGFLVALVHDFVIEVPAPAAAARGGLFGPAARVFRISAPNAEVAMSFKVAPAAPGGPLHLSGRIEEFDPGQGAQVFALNEDENAAAELNAFARVAVLNTFAAKLRGQPVDLPLTNARIPNFALSSVSNLDPSGWMRVVLSPTR